MFKFQEVQLLSPSINGRQELVFKIKVKPEDYTLEMFKELAEQFESKSFACVLAPFQDEKIEDPLPRLRQQLAMVIKEYCEVGGYKEEAELQRIYKAYNVSSRGEMKDYELRSEIESYRAGISQYNS